MAAPTGPRRADGRRNRERLLVAAEAVIARDGAGASLEEIARRAGVGSATLHRHFPGRRALLDAVFHEGVVRLCRRAEELLDAPDPREGLATWLEELAVYSATTRGVATALLAGPDGHIAEEDTCHGLMHDAAGGLVVRAREAGQLRAEATTDDLLALTNALSLACEGDPDAARRLLRLSLGGFAS
ncbi:TetR/AcrR family transcriptional regulator [Actinomycetospora sp. TBRC 11914]|uniref:TetR/AcrR family transcriptional regulator n=1 Tax=Actinomycetospora sp. TBRC 11914 TaxID=2729387 RepID=UPI00145CC7BA|nr:TetR/AcrR family transcriptional regulator [Actinomycetospora sp. TBRC 11914]NMO91521.1 TetR/AcrR family transcriptional regulator [Actinomycetospora sp. TBRC 11914]